MVQPAASPTPAVARLEIFSNPVTLQLSDNSATQSAKPNTMVPEGAIIETGATGRAQITYPGGTVTRLDANTRIQLQLFQPQPERIAVKILEGKTWSRIKKLFGNESYQTETGTTVATVRGTSYEHSVDENNENIVLVDEGIVDFGCATEKRQKNVPVAANKKALTNCTGDNTIEPVPVDPDDLQDEWVTFNKKENEKLKKKKKQKPTTTGAVQGAQTNNPADTSAPAPTNSHPGNRNSRNPRRNNDILPSIIPTTIISPASTINTDTIFPTLTLIPTVPTLPPMLPTEPPSPTQSPRGNNNALDLNVGVGDSKVHLRLGQ